MSIQDIKAKIKLFTKLDNFNIKEDVFIILAIILIGLASFGLGKLSALEKNREAVTIKQASFTAIAATTTINSVSASAMIASESAKGMLVASKTGQKYHFPWCAGASQIAEKNKIWFDSYESAQKAGLSAAANCPNLK